jgi:hypothetical protein
MKQVLIIFLVILSINSFAQKDTTKVKSDTVCVLSIEQVREIANYIQIQMSGKADIKNGTWQNVLAILANNIKIIPNKEQLKK